MQHNSDVHAIGIRSKTRLSERVLREAKNLIVIGCFCIGTNQVDLDYAAKHGITVFNSPFSNSRSVAELVIGEILDAERGAHGASSSHSACTTEAWSASETWGLSGRLSVPSEIALATGKSSGARL